MITRRRLLRALPTAPLAATLMCVAATPARAFRVEEQVPEALRQAYDEARACARQPWHDELRAEVEAALEGKPVTPELRREIAAATDCPFCGCRIVRG